MPYQPTVSEETELDGLPRRLPDQNAILIGRVVGESEYSGLAAYYMHGRGSILLGKYANQEFLPEYTVKCENRLISANVREFQTTELETELSSIGKALLQAWHLGDLTPLSHKQSHVYALRERGGFSRNETAEILNISESTSKTQYKRGKSKLMELLKETRDV